MAYFSTPITWRRGAIATLVMGLFLTMSGLQTRAAMWVEPAYPKDALKGPAAAEGAFIWSHGNNGNSWEDEATTGPPRFASLLREKGWDVFLFKRTFHEIGAPEPQAHELQDQVMRLKSQGYRKIILGGQSQGAWISLMVAGSSADIFAVIANAPATYGWRPPRNAMNASDLYVNLEHINRGRIMISYFRDDPYDPGGRGERSDEILSQHGVSHLVLDRPEGLTGHGAGESAYFYRRFGPCVLALVEDGAVPQRKACETHWGDEPSGEIPLPRNLTITPGASGPAARFVGRWYGTYTSGLEVMLFVTRVDGDWAEAVYAWGPKPRVEKESDKGGYWLRAGTANGDTLEFVGKGNVTLRYQLNQDGTLREEWTDVDQSVPFTNVLRKLRPQ
jgi:predicted esterase